MRRRLETDTALGLRSNASAGVKESLIKYLKKDAERVGADKTEEIIKLTTEPEQLSFSEEILQAGNSKRNRAA